MNSPEEFSGNLEQQFEGAYRKNLNEFLENSEEDFPEESKQLIDSLVQFHLTLSTIANLEQAMATRNEEANIIRVTFKNRPEELEQKLSEIEASISDIQGEIRQHQDRAEKISDTINSEIDKISFGNEDIKMKLETFLEHAKDIADMTRREIH